jgi:hypothetical protein
VASLSARGGGGGGEVTEVVPDFFYLAALSSQQRDRRPGPDSRPDSRPSPGLGAEGKNEAGELFAISFNSRELGPRGEGLAGQIFT